MRRAWRPAVRQEKRPISRPGVFNSMTEEA
jgi:hypothetical protein